MCPQVRNGHIKRITDNDIHSQVLEVEGANVRWGLVFLSSDQSSWSDSFILVSLSLSPCSTTYITCPADPKKTLGIKLPFLVMIIKNLKKYFTFEVQVGIYALTTPWGFVSDIAVTHNSRCVSFLRCWMIKMFVGGFGRVTIRAQREWSHSSAPCPWGWMTAGIKFSSICRISPGEPTEPITLRRYACRLVFAV